LQVPDFKFWSNTRPSQFDYPPKVEESANKEPEKVATAVLSTTAKARQRAKRSEKEKKEKEAAENRKDGDAMDIEPTSSTPVPEEKMEVDEEKEKEEKEGKEEKKDGEGDKKKRLEKEKVGYEVQNLSRVLPAQLPYISFPAEARYEPVKKVGNFLPVVPKAY
jgi:26S proteasome regulatory subunit N2